MKNKWYIIYKWCHLSLLKSAVSELRIVQNNVLLLHCFCSWMLGLSHGPNTEGRRSPRVRWNQRRVNPYV